MKNQIPDSCCIFDVQNQKPFFEFKNTIHESITKFIPDCSVHKPRFCS